MTVIERLEKNEKQVTKPKNEKQLTKVVFLSGPPKLGQNILA